MIHPTAGRMILDDEVTYDEAGNFVIYARCAATRSVFVFQAPYLIPFRDVTERIYHIRDGVTIRLIGRQMEAPPRLQHRPRGLGPKG